ncbi:organic hydroperoxide reductase OsmC/OhrA [Deinobacterium chartae]|uniref:Organic hydroperoxide reductase OsmC/OhrA n=1 Tax=Deinobacterium chartae TaxID=521158 RepID=A0A841HZR6_9DEIO|nr:OsmC family protein [Deinobacterium chartae]MBB6098433.1 organic hydroperoxide reductase OsmC/OhrA [Deinobacterium chartae]
MSHHTATVRWEREQARFVDRRYSRAHRWSFDGGLELPASSSPHVVPLPYSDPAGVDPEEAYVAALSSCHMLGFLFAAARRGFCVERYQDEAVGVMEPNEAGKAVISRVTLRPQVLFSGTLRPDEAAVAELHREAHDECFLANSVRTVVETRGSWSYLEPALTGA